MVLGIWDDFGVPLENPNPYAAPFWYYIDGKQQTASGVPAFVRNARNGRLYEAGGVKAWYPAPGYRDYTNGMLFHVDDFGYSSSSSIRAESGTAHNLNFGPSWIAPQNHYYRAYGLPVRCLQEEPTEGLLGRTRGTR